MKDTNKPVISLTFTEEQYEEYNTKIKNLVKTADYYIMENRRLTDELKEAENRIDILDEENNKLVARLIANRAKYKEENDKLTDELKIKNESDSESKKYISELQDEIISLRRKVRDLNIKQLKKDQDIKHLKEENDEFSQKNQDMVELLSRTRKEYEEDLYLIDRARTKDKEEIRKLNTGLRKKNDQIKQLLATRKYLYGVIAHMEEVSDAEYKDFADHGIIYGKDHWISIHKIKDPNEVPEFWLGTTKKTSTEQTIKDTDNGIGTTRYSSSEDMWKDLVERKEE